MSKLVKKYWPQWCRSNRPFLTEDQIVMDIVNKIKGSRTSLLWWVLTEPEDVIRYDQKHKNIIARYYSIGNPKNPHFNKTESTDVIQSRILHKVWKIIHVLDEQWMNDGSFEPQEDRPNK